MKQKSIGSKHTESAGVTGRSSGGSNDPAAVVICVANRGNEVSLRIGKAYRVLQPLKSDPAGRLRVVDEEGEDYLYPAEWFVPVEAAASGKEKLLAAISR